MSSSSSTSSRSTSCITPDEDGDGTFAVEFARAVNRRDLRASFLVSMREDSIAKLDFFKGRIPNLFDNYLRIDRLDREQAREAIVRPIEQFNRLAKHAGAPFTVEPGLVEAVLDQVRATSLTQEDTGRALVKRGREVRNRDAAPSAGVDAVCGRRRSPPDQRCCGWTLSNDSAVPARSSSGTWTRRSMR